MRITSDQIVQIKEYLFENGIILTNDTPQAIHNELNIADKKIMSYLKTLISKGYVQKTFVWQHGYYFLTDEGVEWLRDDLCMEENDMPLTYEMVASEVQQEDVKERNL